MLNPDETSIEIKKYLRKLVKIINEEASFTFFKVKIVEKKRIDDILCCVDATFPDEYKAYVKKHGPKSLKTAGQYRQLLDSIRRKFWLNPDSYAVLYSDAIGLISLITNSLDADFKRLFDSNSGMF